jgi:preprotein translocase subunit SecG
MTITVASLRGNIDDDRQIAVTVTDESGEVPGVGGGAGEETGLFGDRQTTDAVALLFIVLAIVFMVVMVLTAMLYKRKSKRLSELEGRRRAEPASMVDAELAFSPEGGASTTDLGGAGGIAADRQLGTGAGGPAPGPGAAAVPDTLQLPKVATGGEPAPAGGTETAGPDYGAGPDHGPGPDHGAGTTDTGGVDGMEDWSAGGTGDGAAEVSDFMVSREEGTAGPKLESAEQPPAVPAGSEAGPKPKPRPKPTLKPKAPEGEAEPKSKPRPKPKAPEGEAKPKPKPRPKPRPKAPAKKDAGGEDDLGTLPGN